MSIGYRGSTGPAAPVSRVCSALRPPRPREPSSASPVEPLLHRYEKNTSPELEEIPHMELLEPLIKKAEFLRVWDLLQRENVHPILMKGFPLSFLIYSAPHLRPHTDIDLLIQKSQKETVKKIMTGIGYEIPSAIEGDFVSHEFCAARLDENGIEHAYDFHWKISNPALFSDLLSFEEIEREALRVPALGEDVRTLGFLHALLLACVHRVAHHADEERPIWLYDIHLLAERLSQKEREDFVELALQKKVAAVCADGVEKARRRFGMPLPAEFEALAAAQKDEPSKTYLVKQNARRRDLAMNVRSLAGVRERLVYLRELAFPSGDYMFRKYGLSGRPAWILPFLYLKRGREGLRKLF